MADPQEPEGPTSPAKKTPAKKTPAKKAPAKKTPAKKAAAKTAPAQKVPAKKAPAKKAPAKKAPPALASPPPQAALLPAVPAAGAPAKHEGFGRGHAIPISLALAGAGLAGLVLGRLWRR